MKCTLTRFVLSTALTTKPRVESFRIADSHARSFLRIRDFGCLSLLRGGSEETTSISVPHFPLPLSFVQERQNDVNIAILSVLASCRVTRWLQPNTGSNIATITKQDASPVTIGDFASQATTLKILHDNFPSDTFIAEEGSAVLRADEDLSDKVWSAVTAVSPGMESICCWRNKEELLNSIDYGQGIDSYDIAKTSERRRVWCLDPIDGTKGFLRGRIEGGQYCIALALLEDGIPVVSILGCPNQPQSSSRQHLTDDKDAYGKWSEDEIEEVENSDNDNTNNLFSSKRGCLFVAVRGCGCYEVSISDLEALLFRSTNNEQDALIWKRLQVTSLDDMRKKTPSQATFCLGVERGFSDPKGTVLKIAQILHGKDALVMNDGTQDIKNSFRMDGQGKYGILARGEAEYFLRLPKPGYIDWVWDVAAGYLILKEAGGTMTDVNGNQIDFSEIGVNRLAKLPNSVQGLLGSCGGVFHDVLIDAYKSVEKS